MPTDDADLIRLANTLLDSKIGLAQKQAILVEHLSKAEILEDTSDNRMQEELHRLLYCLGSRRERRALALIMNRIIGLRHVQ